MKGGTNKMENERVRKPEEYAEIEMNKKIGKAIASRKMKIKRLEEEIRKLKSGEMQPDDEDEKSSDSAVKIIEKERIKEVPVYIPRPEPIPNIPIKPFPERPWNPWKPLWINRRIICYSKQKNPYLNS
jgi:hypothetical protein